MTREEIKRRAELYSALADGKTIQVQLFDGKWDDIDINEFKYIFNEHKYRIKPETKYRPFKNQEECWLEMHKHPDFGWGLNNVGEYVNLSRISNDRIFTKGDAFDFNKALKDFRFTDGKPFGIIEE